ncbi:FAD-dependent oxidoreductase, partial [Pauljensenia sp. OF14-1SRA]|uniref:FAD-dependent oxidoreductase n=1 Tax=Pauljensenia sp. OF14-1SRA TaxID=2998062 RepID=UPI0022E333DD
MSEAIEAELVLVALGARARIELAESAGIEVENGAIVVDGCGGTSNPRIWAVGDAVISTSGLKDKKSWWRVSPSC